MLKFKTENKAATESAWPWELLPEEREELAAARADLRLAKKANTAARERGPAGVDANYSAEILAARDQERFARLRLEGLKDQLRRAVQRRLTPPELLETD